jgi:hypothetical protein
MRLGVFQGVGCLTGAARLVESLSFGISKGRLCSGSRHEMPSRWVTRFPERMGSMMAAAQHPTHLLHQAAAASVCAGARRERSADSPADTLYASLNLRLNLQMLASRAAGRSILLRRKPLQQNLQAHRLPALALRVLLPSVNHPSQLRGLASAVGCLQEDGGHPVQQNVGATREPAISGSTSFLCTDESVQKFVVANFYHLVDFGNPLGEVDRHAAFMKVSVQS